MTVRIGGFACIYVWRVVLLGPGLKKLVFLPGIMGANVVYNMGEPGFKKKVGFG
jgi:UDP-N-acetylenolpyruvoylglucosamine reductase